MLKNKRQNYHHSKLPNVGDIVTVKTRPLQQGESYKKFMVESFNLCDNVLPYSVGIHLVNIVDLANRDNRLTVAGHWCEVIA